MRNSILVLAIIVSFAQQSWASPHDRSPAPEAWDLVEVPPGEEARFSALIAEVAAAMEEIPARFGGSLEIDADWKSDSVNATALRRGDKWILKVWGGLYRVAGMNADAFQLTVCHEAGHLMGGYSFYPDSAFSGEGQADYFAAHICMPRVLAGRTESSRRAFAKAPESIQRRCRDAHEDPKRAHICARIALAGETTIRALGSDSVDLETPDPTQVDRTILSAYPEPQCRVDTYFRGALCDYAPSPWTIPGLSGSSIGGNGPQALEEALAASCRSSRSPQGKRPQCWFVE